MKIDIEMITNLKTAELQAKVDNAAQSAIKDVTIAIASDVVKLSPWKTGNNRRSIDFTLSKYGSSIFSTSGYGGYLETGTVRRGPTPYFRPALDLHIHEIPEHMRRGL